MRKSINNDMFGDKNGQDFHIDSKGKARPSNKAAKKSLALEHAKENKPYHPRTHSPKMLTDFKKSEERRQAKRWTTRVKKEQLKTEHDKWSER